VDQQRTVDECEESVNDDQSRLYSWAAMVGVILFGGIVDDAIDAATDFLSGGVDLLVELFPWPPFDFVQIFTNFVMWIISILVTGVINAVLWFFSLGVESFMFFDNPRNVPSLNTYWTDMLLMYTFILGAMMFAWFIHYMLVPDDEQAELNRIVSRVLLSGIILAFSREVFGLVVQFTHLISKAYYPDTYRFEFAGYLLEAIVSSMSSAFAALVIGLAGAFAIFISGLALYLILAMRMLVVYIVYAILPLLIALWVVDTGIGKYGKMITDFSIKILAMLLLIGVLTSAMLAIGSAYGVPSDVEGGDLDSGSDIDLPGVNYDSGSGSVTRPIGEDRPHNVVDQEDGQLQSFSITETLWRLFVFLSSAWIVIAGFVSFGGVILSAGSASSGGAGGFSGNSAISGPSGPSGQGRGHGPWAAREGQSSTGSTHVWETDDGKVGVMNPAGGGAVFDPDSGEFEPDVQSIQPSEAPAPDPSMPEDTLTVGDKIDHAVSSTKDKADKITGGGISGAKESYEQAVETLGDIPVVRQGVKVGNLTKRGARAYGEVLTTPSTEDSVAKLRDHVNDIRNPTPDEEFGPASQDHFKDSGLFNDDDAVEKFNAMSTFGDDGLLYNDSAKQKFGDMFGDDSADPFDDVWNRMEDVDRELYNQGIDPDVLDKYGTDKERIAREERVAELVEGAPEHLRQRVYGPDEIPTDGQKYKSARDAVPEHRQYLVDEKGMDADSFDTISRYNPGEETEALLKQKAVNQRQQEKLNKLPDRLHPEAQSAVQNIAQVPRSEFRDNFQVVGDGFETIEQLKGRTERLAGLEVAPEIDIDGVGPVRVEDAELGTYEVTLGEDGEKTAVRAYQSGELVDPQTGERVEFSSLAVESGAPKFEHGEEYYLDQAQVTEFDGKSQVKLTPDTEIVGNEDLRERELQQRLEGTDVGVGNNISDVQSELDRKPLRGGQSPDGYENREFGDVSNVRYQHEKVAYTTDDGLKEAGDISDKGEVKSEVRIGYLQSTTSGEEMPVVAFGSDGDTPLLSTGSEYDLGNVGLRKYNERFPAAHGKVRGDNNGDYDQIALDQSSQILSKGGDRTDPRDLLDAGVTPRRRAHEKIIEIRSKSPIHE